MADTSSAEQDFQALRDQANGALLATIAPSGAPCASYAPMIWRDGSCYFFLSELAAHTTNLRANPNASLLLLEPEQDAANAFARQRISLEGQADVVERGASLFAEVLSEFHRRFGEVMSVIEPLPDFHLFRIRIVSGQFVRGFGQAYRLAGEKLDRLKHIRPGA